MPQFFKENLPLVQFCTRLIDLKNAHQYQREERTLLLQRAEISQQRLDLLLDAMANDTIYGLSAMVWSLDINNALQTIRGIRAGRCWVNGTREGLVEMPIGGYKQSGQGRELGHRGFEEYSEFKNIYVNLGVSEPWGPARR